MVRVLYVVARVQERHVKPLQSRTQRGTLPLPRTCIPQPIGRSGEQFCTPPVLKRAAPRYSLPPSAQRSRGERCIFIFSSSKRISPYIRYTHISSRRRQGSLSLCSHTVVLRLCVRSDGDAVRRRARGQDLSYSSVGIRRHPLLRSRRQPRVRRRMQQRPCVSLVLHPPSDVVPRSRSRSDDASQERAREQGGGSRQALHG